MKIIHFDLAPGFRGGQRQALLLHRNLRRLGIDSVLAVDAKGRLCQKAQHEGIEGIAPIRVSRRRPDALGRLASAPAVAAFLRRERPDVVHFHEPASLMFWPLAGRALKVETRRVSFPIKPLSVRMKYAPLDLHVGVSDEISDYLRSCGLAPVTTIRSGIDLERFAQPPTARPLAGRPGFKLLYVGSFHKMKGIELLAAALERVSRTEPSVELHMVGDGELLPDFRERLRSVGLEHCVLFHGFRDDTESFFADADVVLVPSTYGEGSNGIIKEAMASGKSVIASDLACNAELVEHGVDGLLFRNGDAEDLARTISAFRMNAWPLDSDRMREKAGMLSDRKMSAAYLELYKHYAMKP